MHHIRFPHGALTAPLPALLGLGTPSDTPYAIVRLPDGCIELQSPGPVDVGRGMQNHADGSMFDGHILVAFTTPRPMTGEERRKILQHIRRVCFGPQKLRFR